MNNPEDMWSNSFPLFGVTVNDLMVPAFEQSGRWWYQLSALFRALELQEPGVSTLTSKAGNLFFDTMEFQKYRGSWFGTAAGLSLFAEYLYKSQFWLFIEQDRETASTRHCILRQWLSSIAEAPPELYGSEDNEDGSANNTFSSEEPVAKGNAQSDTIRDAEAAIGAAKSSMIPNGPVVRMMMDNLLTRADLLCGAFGIDPHLPRDEKLSRIVWLLVFHGCDTMNPPIHDLDATKNDMEPEGFLWRGKQWGHVKDLVEAAMVE